MDASVKNAKIICLCVDINFIVLKYFNTYNILSENIPKLKKSAKMSAKEAQNVRYNCNLPDLLICLFPS